MESQWAAGGEGQPPNAAGGDGVAQLDGLAAASDRQPPDNEDVEEEYLEEDRQEADPQDRSAGSNGRRFDGDESIVQAATNRAVSPGAATAGRSRGGV